MNALRSQFGIGRLATQLEFTLLAVKSAFCTSGRSLVAAIAADA
jgi:hypothetical protein